jgi:hypothetical protein
LTKNRYVVINGTAFSCYDIDWTLNTKYITLDGYNIIADADFQMFNAQQTRYDIFMPSKNGSSVYVFAVHWSSFFRWNKI